jgi:hypothetical protein
MTNSTIYDPYAGNILIEPLGPLRSRLEVMSLLTELPKRPKGFDSLPSHIALHELLRLRDFHVPTPVEIRLHQSIDLMIRQNYRYLNPAEARTWSTVGGESFPRRHVRAPEFGAAVEGLSGTGKTQAVLRCLNTYSQIFIHPNFPRLVGSHMQVIWLSVDVPASGRSSDLAAALMIAWDRATGGQRFKESLARRSRSGMVMLEEWQQVASSHFLGVLHLDEIQNLFKLSALKKRSKRSGEQDAPELSIVEDQSLKWILTLMNTWQIPLLVSGTPDGMRALTRRMSNAERLATSGYHLFRAFSPDDPTGFRNLFLEPLGQYQYIARKLSIDDDLARLILQLTAGVPRLVVALWISAQRIALERDKGNLTISDLKQAAGTYLAPVAPAVAALLSNDPKRMSRYEDLLPNEDAFWSQVTATP